MKMVSARALRTFVAPALAAAAFLTAGPAAYAQNAAPTGVRGTVTSLSGDLLKVHTRDGKDVDVKLAKDTPIRGVVLADVNDIKPDSYVGTAAIPQADGTLKALEVHVFPASMRGAGEGHRPWDLGGNSSMTNGTVGSLVVSNGRTITVNGEFEPCSGASVALTFADAKSWKNSTVIELVFAFASTFTRASAPKPVTSIAG